MKLVILIILGAIIYIAVLSVIAAKFNDKRRHK